MPPTLLITRAKADALPLAAELRAKGYDVLIDPMLHIQDLAGPPLELVNVQGLLLTSANGVRAFCQRNSERQVAVYAVGEATGREARAQGFDNIKIAAGDVDALARLVMAKTRSEEGWFLHCAGTHLAGDLGAALTAAGYRYRREQLYQARAAQQLRASTVAALQGDVPIGVLLYSPRTAAIFCQCVVRAGLGDRLNLVTAYCLSQAVTKPLTTMAWRAIKIPQRPTQEALLEIVLDRV